VTVLHGLVDEHRAAPTRASGEALLTLLVLEVWLRTFAVSDPSRPLLERSVR
jgi:hypothetical protein